MPPVPSQAVDATVCGSQVRDNGHNAPAPTKGPAGTMPSQAQPYRNWVSLYSFRWFTVFHGTAFSLSDLSRTIRFLPWPVWGCAWLGSLLLPAGFAGIFSWWYCCYYPMVLRDYLSDARKSSRPICKCNPAFCKNILHLAFPASREKRRNCFWCSYFLDVCFYLTDYISSSVF